LRVPRRSHFLKAARPDPFEGVVALGVTHSTRPALAEGHEPRPAHTAKGSRRPSVRLKRRNGYGYSFPNFKPKGEVAGNPRERVNLQSWGAVVPEGEWDELIQLNPGLCRASRTRATRILNLLGVGFLVPVWHWMILDVSNRLKELNSRAAAKGIA
jgi:hypothetical protein